MNFDYSDFIDYNKHAFKNIDHYVDYLLLLAKKKKKNILAKNFVFIGIIVWEPWCLNDEHKTFYKDVLNSFAKKGINTILILDSCYEHIDTTEYNTEIIFIPYFLWLHHFLIFNKKMNAVSTTWKQDSDKFLALTGKSFRFNRIRLIWLLHQKGLLDKAIWSLFVTEGTKSKAKTHIPELSDVEFDAWIKLYNNNPDDAKMLMQKDSSHYIGVPYNVDLFDNSLFRVISETTFSSTSKTPFITEKTYHTIFNKLPFIMAGDRGSLKWLKQQGFKTFEEYLPVPNYDDIIDENERLNAVLENCKFWCGNMMHKENIAQDVEHNFQTALNLAHDTTEKLNHIMIDLGNPNVNPEQ